MTKRVSFTVHGKVQGVFFRDFTQQKASLYNLTGWVKNTPAGTVEGEAQGDEGSIEKLLEDVAEGPSAARVSNVDHTDMAPKEGESGFEA